MTNQLPTVSIIIPMRNEEAFIAQCLDKFCEQDFPTNNFEILVVDGLSNDRSVEIIKTFQNKYANIKLLINPQKHTPSAFNLGIKASKADYVGIFSAHSIPSKTYISSAIQSITKTNADCVGGPMIAMNNSIIGGAIAYATSTPFGVGGSVFHYSKKPQYARTVYQGFFERKLFSKIGFFDEDLVRNQDDELSYRIEKYGGKIFYDPSIKSTYYSRSSFQKLIIQYFQYGLYKPLVFQKLKYGMQVHHIIPATFVLYILSLLIVPFNMIYISPLIGYAILCIVFSIKSQFKLVIKLNIIFAYVLMHISYGAGFIVGIIRWLFIGKRQFGTVPPPTSIR